MKTKKIPDNNNIPFFPIWNRRQTDWRTYIPSDGNYIRWRLLTAVQLNKHYEYKTRVGGKNLRDETMSTAW